MTYTSILVHLDLTTDSRRRVELAQDLACRFGARIIGACAAEPSDTVLLMGGLPAGLLAEHEAQLEAACAGARSQFASAVQGLPSEWRSSIASPREFLRRNACAADLVVVGRSSAEPPNEFRLAAADAVMAAGRPVLVVPPGVERLAADRIMVAWKTTRASALAVQLAFPLLVRAERVVVLGVGEETSQPELDDVCDHLKRHGVRADTERRDMAGEGIDRTIVQTAVAHDADLIVCGAYGRSQLFEWVLGGVTEGLLTASPICCLMVH